MLLSLFPSEIQKTSPIHPWVNYGSRKSFVRAGEGEREMSQLDCLLCLSLCGGRGGGKHGICTAGKGRMGKHDGFRARGGLQEAGRPLVRWCGDSLRQPTKLVRPLDKTLSRPPAPLSLHTFSTLLTIDGRADATQMQ